MKPNRIGLTFNQDHITGTQAKDDSEHIAAAFDFLTDTRDKTPLVHAYLLGLRYRFMNDSGSGDRAIELISQARLDEIHDYRPTIQDVVAWLNVAEMVRDLPAWQTLESSWLEQHVQPIVDALNQPPEDATLLDGFWLGVLNIGAGIVLNNETIFAKGQEFYQLAIDQYIHPEGYLKGIVEDGDETVTNTYQKQVSGVAALTLMAEMAEMAEVDLWGMNNRGVTPITAATYTLYYYYYPEKWKWEENLTLEAVEPIMKTDGAFIEIVNRRSPLRAIEQLFEDQRPMFNVYGGGLTTLTHGAPAPRKKKRWSLFGN